MFGVQLTLGERCRRLKRVELLSIERAVKKAKNVFRYMKD